MMEFAAKELFEKAASATTEEEGGDSSAGRSGANGMIEDGEDGQMNIAAVYKDVPDNGYTVPESEVDAYMLNDDEATKRLKIREAMFGAFLKDRDRRKAEKVATFVGQGYLVIALQEVSLHKEL